MAGPTPFLLDNPKDWTLLTISELSRDIYERDETLAFTLLTVMSGQSVFLFGPPGTAKSLIARRISCIFDDVSYFEYLMQRFSTPEEIFGPVSIAELKNDRYIRRTENYLPEADIAFLDEIWKSSPAILNTLLTIINERKFKNGSQMMDVPLKAVIAASNEIPAEGSGLNALYDRFITRLRVDPVREDSSFVRLVSEGPADGTVSISSKITAQEWTEFFRRIDDVPLDDDLIDIILSIRSSLKDSEDPVYVSDRRWQKAISLLKASALLSGRVSASPADAFILTNVLWSDPADSEIVRSAVDSALSGHYADRMEAFRSWQARFAELEKEARGIFTGSRDLKPPVEINDIACYELKAAIGPNNIDVTVYIPYVAKTVGGVYNAYSQETDGTYGANYSYKVTDISDGMATIVFNMYSKEQYRVPLRFGTAKDVAPEVRETYLRAVRNIISDLQTVSVLLEDAVRSCISGLEGPFVPVRSRESFRMELEGYLKEAADARKSSAALLEHIESYDA